MKEPSAVARILSSAKFWTLIIGLVVTVGASALARWGLELSDSAIQQIAVTVSGLFAILLGAQAVTGAGKERVIEERVTAVLLAALSQGAAPKDAIATARASARPSVPPANANATVVADTAKVGMLLLLVVGVVLALSSTAGCGSRAGIIARQGAVDLYDCMNPEAKRVIGEVGPVIERGIRSTIQNDGTLDRAALKEQARSLKTPALRCAFQTGLATVGRVIAALAGAPQAEGQLVNREDAKAAFDEVSAELYGGAKFKIEGEVL